MKDATTQGETKSSPPEIRKLFRYLCERCGFKGPDGMVRNGRCVNEHACARRAKLATWHRAND